MRINESTIRRIIREEARQVLGMESLRINESDFEDEEDFDEEADIPGMRGIPDEAYIASQIVDQLGDDASQSFYDDCMFNSNPSADNELEDYIEDFGGGAFDGSDERHQLKVLRAISHILRGIVSGNRPK
jgi:hypothetical protein